MPQKVPGFSQAVGAWSNVYCRIAADETGAKERALLQDQLLGNGHPAFLWLPVFSTTPGVVACTCDKNTTQNSDLKCLSCFGVRFVPGFVRFLHETLYFSSASVGGTLVNITLDRSKKPNRMVITPSFTTATITTPAMPFANPKADDWEVELQAFRKTTGDAAPTLEFSTDGVNFFAIPVVTGAYFGFRGVITGATKPVGVGSVIFRVTLTRVSGTSPESPSFEILRARHVQRERVNPLITASRPDYIAGQILLLKTWEVEVVARLVAQARVIEHEGDRSWTAPLDFFDMTITHDTPPAAIDDRGPGQHPFFEYSTGVRLNQRYAITRVSLDSTVQNILTHQSFTERRLQEGEAAALVF